MKNVILAAAAFCLSVPLSAVARETCQVPDNKTVGRWSTGFENGISTVVMNETIDSENSCDVQLIFQKWLTAARLNGESARIAAVADFGLKLANPPLFGLAEVKPFWKLMAWKQVEVSHFHLQSTIHQFYISGTLVERMIEKADGWYSHGFPDNAIIDFAATKGKCVELQTTWRPGKETRRYRYFGVQLQPQPQMGYYGATTSNLELWLKEPMVSEQTQAP